MDKVFKHAEFQAILHSQKENARKSTYGEINPIIHEDFAGQKIVGVGNKIYSSPKWKTFLDFLGTYIRDTIGIEWGNSELKKPLQERHQLLKVYDYVCKEQVKHKKKDQEIFSFSATGATNFWYRIAYDLYAIRHHMSLQTRILNRLRISDQFQGARYELFVTAVFLRAGFEIEHEDESDPLTSHPEFTAFHRKTNTRLSVEAKSRHRDGILGFIHKNKSDSLDVKVNVRSILMKALQKKAKYPYFIFIDVNLPKLETPIHESDWFREITSTENLIKEKVWTDGAFPAAAIFYTNDPSPYEWESSGSPIWAFGKPYLDSINSNFPGELFNVIFESLGKAGNIPNHFPEKKKTIELP